MKINKIYISAFGKFKDFTLHFSDGFNLVYGENEKGKSTIMAFVKMMFYGTAGKKGQQLFSRPRLKYKPWSGEEMGGRIYFSHGGHNYCLERQFGKSDSTDKIRLTDTDLSIPLPADSDIGKKFFGFGISAFERSVFIEAGSPYVHDEGGEGELNMRLSNLALTGEEDTSHQTVLNRLIDAKLDIISKSGKTGKLPKNNMSADALKEELARAEVAAIRRKDLMDSITTSEKEFQNLKQEYLKYKKITDLENDFKTKDKLSEYLSLKDKLDTLSENLKLSDGATLDEMFVKSIDFCIGKVKGFSEKLKEKQEDIDKRREAIRLESEKSTTELQAELSEAKEKCAQNERAKVDINGKIDTLSAKAEEAKRVAEQSINLKKPFSPALLGIGAALFIGAVVCGVLKISVAAIALAALTVIIEILAFVIRPLDTSKYNKAKSEYDLIFSQVLDLKNQLNTLTGEGIEYSSRINMLTASLNSDAAIKNQRLLDLKESEDEFAALKEKYTESEKELLTIYGRYKQAESIDEITDILPLLTEKTEKLKNIKLKLNYLSRDLNNISYEEAKEKLEFLKGKELPEDIDFKDAREKAEELNESIMALSGRRSALAAELKSEFSKAKEPEIIKRELQEILKKSDELKEYYDALSLAEEVLSESFALVRRGYGAALENKTLDIFSRLTLKNYDAISVSKSLDITTQKSGIFGMKEAEYLSSGTYDQAYLSLRLAISELMNENETLPIFLDDVLSLYDDARTCAAMDFLKEYSEGTQCLLFTCHGSLKELAKKENLSVIEL